jgi:hypothetical protein
VESSGSEGGTQATDEFVAERERFETQRRELQSKYDRAMAENAKLKASNSAPTENAGSTDALTVDQMRAEMYRMTSLQETLAEVRSSDEYKHADPGLFTRALEFDSPEEFRVAAGESHRERAAIYEAGYQAGRAIPGAPPETTPDRGPSASGSTAPPTGLPTKEQIAAFDQREYDAFVEKHGWAVVEQILTA